MWEVMWFMQREIGRKFAYRVLRDTVRARPGRLRIKWPQRFP
jgi:hypothetical protein